MKSEVISFTIGTTGAQILTLNDATLQPKAVWFQISKAGGTTNLSSGFSDATSNRAMFTLQDGAIQASGRSTTYSAWAKAKVSGATTVVVAGKVNANGFATAGEIGMTFDTVDSGYTIDGIVIGV